MLHTLCQQENVVCIFENLTLYFRKLSSAFLGKTLISLNPYTNVVNKPIKPKLSIKSNLLPLNLLWYKIVVCCFFYYELL